MIIPCTVDPEETLLDEKDFLILKNCQVAFMSSSQNIYIQLSDYYEQLDCIQPIVDSCLDPFDIAKTNLCIAQSPEDGLNYRCRVRNWDLTLNKAGVTFIDFGDYMTVSIETLKAMNAYLLKVKPLVLRCKFKNEFSVNSKAWKNFEKLVLAEVKWNVCVNKTELARFYESMEVDVEPLFIRLFLTDESNLEVNEVNLGEDTLWEKFHLLNDSKIQVNS